MPLTFPTMAEQALASGQPFSKICPKMRATRDDDGVKIVWVFPDDTTLHVTGRGPNQRAWAELP